MRHSDRDSCGSHTYYRLTCDEFDQLFARAGGRCEICRIPVGETATGKIFIDHDHKLGNWAVRGLLCPICNQRLRDWMAPLGFRERPEAQKYLKNPFRGADQAPQFLRRRPHRRAQRAVCRRGHPLTDDNVYTTDKRRLCRTCALRRQAEYAARRKQKVSPTGQA